MTVENQAQIKFNYYEPIAGHPEMESCLQEALELAESIKPLIIKQSDLSIQDKRKNRRRKRNSYKRALENFMINRRRYRKGNHALRPLYVIWSMLNSCNFRCTYCDNHRGEHYFDIPDPDRLSTSKSKKLLEVMYTGTTAIYWCGGEPTMRKDLPELLDYAWNMGFFPNIINTNGSLLHTRLLDPEWKRFLWQMDIIVISLDGLNISRLNSLWGVKKARQVIVNLLMMRELKKHIKFKLAVNTVITPESIDEARDVLNLAYDLDIWYVPVPVNFKHSPNKGLLENPEYIELANLILDRKKKGQKIIGSYGLLKKLLFAEDYQCVTALKPHVWSNGNICWPCRASTNIDSVDINLLDYDSFDEAYEAGRKLINPDNFHGAAKNQCGGNCAWMQNYTTARYVEGLARPFRSDLLSEISEFTN